MNGDKQIIGSETRGGQQGTADDLGPGQFGQCAKSAVVPARARSRLSAHRRRHGVRQKQRARLSRDESQRPRADAGRRRLRAVGIQFDHALSRARLWQGIADLSRRRRRRAPASTAGWTGRCRRCSRSIARCSGRWCERRSKSATWSRSRRTPTPKPCNGGSSTRSWRARRFIEGDAVHDRRYRARRLCAALVRRRGHQPSRSLPHLERWFAQFAGRPGFAKFIAPPMS